MDGFTLGKNGRVSLSDWFEPFIPLLTYLNIVFIAGIFHNIQYCVVSFIIFAFIPIFVDKLVVEWSLFAILGVWSLLCHFGTSDPWYNGGIFKDIRNLLWFLTEDECEYSYMLYQPYIYHLMAITRSQSKDTISSSVQLSLIRLTSSRRKSSNSNSHTKSNSLIIK